MLVSQLILLCGILGYHNPALASSGPVRIARTPRVAVPSVSVQQDAAKRMARPAYEDENGQDVNADLRLTHLVRQYHEQLPNDPVRRAMPGYTRIQNSFENMPGRPFEMNLSEKTPYSKNTAPYRSSDTRRQNLDSRLLYKPTRWPDQKTEPVGLPESNDKSIELFKVGWGDSEPDNREQIEARTRRLLQQARENAQNR